MILPNVRSGFGREDAIHLVHLLGRDDAELRESARQRLDEEGLDVLLDDPRVLNALLTDPHVSAPPALIFYVLVRQSLLEGGIDSRALADYATTLVVRFGQAKRAYRVAKGADDEYHYLTDIVLHMEGADGRETFLLSAHLGNFALWIAGLFPQYVAARRHRRGAPPLSYYEQMGTTGFRMAADSTEASRPGCGGDLPRRRRPLPWRTGRAQPDLGPTPLAGDRRSRGTCSLREMEAARANRTLLSVQGDHRGRS